MYIPHTIFDLSIINNVLVFEETDSTNTQAKHFADAGSVPGTLLVADSQTGGRGRLGRSFSSPANEGIYMSLLLKPELEVSVLSRITLVAAMAVCDALDEIPGINASIKWPNDVLINEKKAVGILTEFHAGEFVIVGIGINVNNSSFPDSINGIATSLLLETGCEQDCTDLLLRVCYYFDRYYQQFCQTQDLSFLLDDYNRRLTLMNKDVILIPTEQTVKYENSYCIDPEGYEIVHCEGLMKDGSLLVSKADGTITTVDSGEVSIRLSK